MIQLAKNEIIPIGEHIFNNLISHYSSNSYLIVKARMIGTGLLIKHGIRLKIKFPK
jgi:hypothetical protein